MRLLKWCPGVRVAGMGVVSLLVGVCGLVSAQDLAPPQVARAVEAQLPPDEVPSVNTEVVLRIVIDETGAVREVEVVEAAGEPFDEAARAALLQFRFHPATRGETAIASQVLYRYVFEATDTSDPLPEVVNPEARTGDSREVPDPPRTGDDIEDSGFGAAAVVEVDREGILERSAEAVNVIDTREFRSRAVNLGDVLSRQQGVTVRRRGGRGSQSNLALGGLDGEQVRTFVDGLPLEVAGYPFGLPDIQANGFESIEVFRGVVPIRFGLDALGGAINLRSEMRERRTFAAGSYQVGSFGTLATTANTRLFVESTGLSVGLRAHFDHSDNDYSIDVEVPDERGRLSPATVRRFHDAYTSLGGAIDAGWVDRSWARRLRLTMFGAGYDKDLQHNVVMTVPYGEVTYLERTYGGNLRYDHSVGDLDLRLVTHLAYRRTDFEDVGDTVYDWFGRRLRPRAIPGEIQSIPTDAIFESWTTYSRLGAGYELNARHRFDAAVSPSFTTRTGENRLRDSDARGRDPLSALQELTKLVVGVSWEAQLFDDRVENILFAKYYFFQTDAEQVLPGGFFRPLTQTRHIPGAGNGLRLLFTDWLWFKAAYEFAARLPTPDEVFGNGVQVIPNLELLPERSHNVNLGVQLDLTESDSTTGTWQAEAYFVARFPRDLIVLLGNDQTQTHQNVFEARGLSLESQFRWTSPDDWVSVYGNLTYNDLRNASSEGAFGEFEGDRIPHRPYFEWTAGAQLRVDHPFGSDDWLTFGGDVHYVHEFFRSWESQGIRAFKQTVPTQVVVGGFVTYGYDAPIEMTWTLEAQNFGDAQAFDFFGVQRPGRAFYLKIAAEL